MKLRQIIPAILFITAISITIPATACTRCQAVEETEPDGFRTPPDIENPNDTDPKTNKPFTLSSTGRYALIINGDHSTLHKANTTLVYRTLKSQGYRSRDIMILNPVPVRDDNDGELYYGRATREGVEKALAILAKSGRINSLTIYVTGHGKKNKRTGQTDIVLDSSTYLSQTALRRLVDRIHCKQLVLISDICYSGGLVNALTKNNSRNIIAISATDSSHPTYCRYFIRAFCDGLGNSVADFNNDGRISLMEAFTHASAIHKKRLANRIHQANTQFRYCGTTRDLVLGRN